MCRKMAVMASLSLLANFSRATTTDCCQEEGKKEEEGEVPAKSEPEQFRRLTYVFREGKSPKRFDFHHILHDMTHVQATEYHNLGVAI